MCVDFVSHSEHELWCAVQNGFTRAQLSGFVTRNPESRSRQNSTVDLFTDFKSRPLGYILLSPAAR